jgi:hypothetical protein
VCAASAKGWQAGADKKNITAESGTWETGKLESPDVAGTRRRAPGSRWPSAPCSPSWRLVERGAVGGGPRWCRPRGRGATPSCLRDHRRRRSRTTKRPSSTSVARAGNLSVCWRVDPTSPFSGARLLAIACGWTSTPRPRVVFIRSMATARQPRRLAGATPQALPCSTRRCEHRGERRPRRRRPVRGRRLSRWPTRRRWLLRSGMGGRPCAGVRKRVAVARGADSFV